MKRLDVNTASIWEPKKGDVLCSRHFRKTDFDRSTPNTKLKPGVIPSVFEAPYHLQVCLRAPACCEHPLPGTVLKTSALVGSSVVLSSSEVHSVGFHRL